MLEPGSGLEPPKSISEWAESASEAADEITRLAVDGRLGDAADLAEYALALPRHPTLNNPYGTGHATLALDRMIDAFAAYELWDEAIQFCMQPDAIGIGNAMVESKRLRLVATAFASKRQLKFRSQILLAKLAKVREQLDWREGLDEHHNDICAPADLIEIDYSANEAARRHIADSIVIVTALQSQRREPGKTAKAIASTSASSLVKARAFAVAKQSRDALMQLAEFAKTTTFPIAAGLVRAESDSAAFAPARLRALTAQLPFDSPLNERVQDTIGNEVQVASAEVAAEPATFPERSLTAQFPLSRMAPDFELVDVYGKSHRLSDRRGQPTLVVFYLGRGCLHCSRQLKNLAPAMEDFNNAGIEVLGVSTDSVETLTKSFRSYRGRIPFTLLSDGDLRTFADYGLSSEGMDEPLHGTFLVDADSEIIWSDCGEEPFMDMEFLLEESRRLLNHRGNQASSRGSADVATSHSPPAPQ